MSFISAIFGGGSTPPPSPPPPPPPPANEETEQTQNGSGTNTSSETGESSQTTETGQTTETTQTAPAQETQSGTETHSGQASAEDSANSAPASESSEPVSESVVRFAASDTTQAFSGELALAAAEPSTTSVQLDISEAELRQNASSPTGSLFSPSSNILSLFEPIDSTSLVQAIPQESEVSSEYTDIVKSYYSISNPDNEIEAILEEYY
ncbi:hypothetical protein DES40_0238 [Litorimonas taeanensis]|uniref:Uncharacterized protein n=1 Tax=Litorimonas taeanensis TaxID=568099 RepID=A0A420WIV1_9PROT|nr:hypothetical protein [Litorimonas taeanensis]RKQ70933.1 hypothetical protein DES40_0238 [Litorimonas taeanensis]